MTSEFSERHPGPTECAELVDVVRALHAQGWAPATSSNFSVRAASGFFISESGVDKACFGREHLLRVTHDGSAMPGETRRRSAETLLHAALYAMEDVGAVLHTHSVNATVCSRLFAPAGVVTLEGYELLKAFAGFETHEARLSVPIFPNSQDMAQLSATISEWLRSTRGHPHAPGFLLSGHGLYTWGRTLLEAKKHLEAFESLFECEWKLATVRGK